MTEERKQQAIELLEQFKDEIVSHQGKAITKHDKKEYDRLYENWVLLDNIEELIIYGENENGK